MAITVDELVGQSALQLIPERFHQAHPLLQHQFIADAGTQTVSSGMELYGRRKDGSEFPIEISLNPLETEQGTLVTSIIRDITARKEAEIASNGCRNVIVSY